MEEVENCFERRILFALFSFVPVLLLGRSTTQNWRSPLTPQATQIPIFRRLREEKAIDHTFERPTDNKQAAFLQQGRCKATDHRRIEPDLTSGPEFFSLLGREVRTPADGVELYNKDHPCRSTTLRYIHSSILLLPPPSSLAPPFPPFTRPLLEIRRGIIALVARAHSFPFFLPRLSSQSISPPFMFLGRSLQGSVSLLNDTGPDQTRSFSNENTGHHLHSVPVMASPTSHYSQEGPQEVHIQSQSGAVSGGPVAQLHDHVSSQQLQNPTSHLDSQDDYHLGSSASSSFKSNVPRTSAATEKKRNHICQTCAKAFTTSGHLARHNKIHTGERNHKCPFPGCDTSCSRQDNLQQQ